MNVDRVLSLDEIQLLIEDAQAAPINENGTSDMWDMLPRIPYYCLPEEFQKAVDKAVTVEVAKRFLYECYPVGHFDNAAADPAFNEKIEKALHSARYLIESTDLTPPAKTGNEKIDKINYEAWQPISLIGSDLVDAWENVANDKGSNKAITTAAKNTQKAIKNNRLVEFFTTHQSRSFNELTKFTRSLPGENMTIDELLHQGTIKGDYVELQTPLSKDNTTILSPWTVSTSQLFDRLIKEFTETGAKSRTITLSLDDYMQGRGLKDKKETRKQVKADLQTLRVSAVSLKECGGKGKKKEELSFMDVNIAEAVGIVRGTITLTLTPTIYNVIKNSPVMPYPPECQKINSKYNPNSYNLLRKIAEHKNMNIGKPNEDIISVATLLKCCPAIPSYKKVKETDRHFADRIIDPFCRDMDALQTIGWEFCHTNNTPLTDEEISDMTYEIFSKLNIHVTWKVYPDQTERLEKIEAKTQRKARPKRGVTHRKRGGNAPQERG